MRAGPKPQRGGVPLAGQLRSVGRATTNRRHGLDVHCTISRTISPMRVAAASDALAGHVDLARDIMRRLRDRDPTLPISNLGNVLPPIRRSADRALYVDGLRKAAVQSRGCFSGCTGCRGRLGLCALAHGASR